MIIDAAPGRFGQSCFIALIALGFPGGKGQRGFASRWAESRLCLELLGVRITHCVSERKSSAALSFKGI